MDETPDSLLFIWAISRLVLHSPSQLPSRTELQLLAVVTGVVRHSNWLCYCPCVTCKFPAVSMSLLVLAALVALDALK